MDRPRTIHDFYGFPDELFAFDYPAPGFPELAGEVTDLARPHWVGADRDQWGLDHGTWSVLAHLFPRADIPVVQLSLNSLKPDAYHFDLGSKLAALREAGVLILSSGNLVHNLSQIDWNAPSSGTAWAHRFDDWAVEKAADDPEALVAASGHRDFRQAVPTPDHYLPLLYTAGLAAAAGTGMRPLVRGHAFGSLSMTCFALGMADFPCVHVTDEQGDGGKAPADQSNI